MRFLSALLVFCVLTSLSCNKTEELGPGFDMQFQQDFTIPPGINVFAVHHFYLKSLPTYFQDLLDRYNVKLEDVARIRTTKAVLSGVYSDADYAFVDQASVRAYNIDDLNDNLELAYRQPVPLDPGNTLPLVPSLADSYKFLTADRVNLDVALWIRTTTRDEIPTRLTLTLRAELK